MKVLLVNGSPYKEGCTYTALCEVSKALNENGYKALPRRIVLQRYGGHVRAEFVFTNFI